MRIGLTYEKGETEEQYRNRLKAYGRIRKCTVDEKMLNFFDSAYCCSVHKSQGSEWNNVVLFDESAHFQEPEKWLYTGITRAKKNLIIIK